jgi:hypothetical protein
MTDFPSIPGKTVLGIRNMATGNESWFIASFASKDDAKDFATSHNMTQGRVATLRRGKVAIKLKGGG